MDKGLQMVQAWLHTWDLLISANNKEIAPELVVFRFQALPKYQFGESAGEAGRPFFAAWCHARISLLWPR